MGIGKAGYGLLAGTLGLSAAPAGYSGTPSDYHSRNYSRLRSSDGYSARTRYYRAGSSHAAYDRSRRAWDEPSR